MLAKIFKNGHIRLFFTGSFFCLAFIWMAVYSYGVDIEEIKVFLILSLLFVAVLIGLGFCMFLLIRIVKRLMPASSTHSLLDKIEASALEGEKESEKASDKK